MTKRFTSLFAAMLALGAAASAGIPQGYYDKAENKSGAELLRGLESCISSHTELSYASLFTHYRTTDCYPGENAIWDIYSTKHWPIGEKCGNYSVIGDCYNREHSVPKSWFNDATPMYTDIMHLYPTDGKVNGQRSNYPYGECSGGTYVASHNGIQPRGRLGKCTTAGYTKTVFEPDDEFKGDLARTYFYMAACYNSRVSTWNSDNFGGTSYPAFSDWTVKMLVRWHKEDPISDKEIARNEAIYGIQHNRNPFIDHPELVDYLWGDKKGEAWKAGADGQEAISLPVNGSEFSLGLSTKGVARKAEMTVKGMNISQDIAVSISGEAFSCDKHEIAAADANKGTTLTITFLPTDNKAYTGTLTLTSGKATTTVTLSGSATDGIPVNAATYVSSDSFIANWVYVGGDENGKYMLNVRDREGSLNGYPVAVDAAAGSYTVRDLQPATEYTYTLYSGTLQGNIVTVTTGGTLPYIEFLFDGDLYFKGQPGHPSAIAEILMNADNIETEITLSIGEPFELSADKAEWGRILRLSPDENRFYLRMNSASEGEFESQLIAETDGYRSDATTIRGSAVAGGGFLETFENGAGINGYCDFLEGSAARWAIKNGGFWNADPAINGNASLRFIKSGDRFIAMADDLATGIGTVTFTAKKWDNNKDATVIADIETSTDGGTTWQKHGSVEISSTIATTFSVDCNVNNAARLRINQTEGNRWLIDDIAITSTTTGLADPKAERHLWDSYSRDGKLIVEITDDSCPEIAIYCIDGSTVCTGLKGTGIHSFEATRGQFYIVAGGDFGRTVLVR